MRIEDASAHWSKAAGCRLETTGTLHPVSLILDHVVSSRPTAISNVQLIRRISDPYSLLP